MNIKLTMLKVALLTSLTPAQPLLMRNGRHSTNTPVVEQHEDRLDRDSVQIEKQQRASVQKKRHKAKAFHVQHKAVPSQKVSKFFERVTDPNKDQRMRALLKDPFRGLDRR